MKTARRKEINSLTRFPKGLQKETNKFQSKLWINKTQNLQYMNERHCLHDLYACFKIAVWM